MGRGGGDGQGRWRVGRVWEAPGEGEERKGRDLEGGRTKQGGREERTERGKRGGQGRGGPNPPPATNPGFVAPSRSS